MMTFDQFLALIPDTVFQKGTSSNIYKIVYVLYQVYLEAYNVSEQVRTVKDIATITGENLDLWAKDYGISEAGLTDAELQVKLSSKISTGEYGTTIPGILKVLSKFVNPLANLMLTERSSSLLGVIWDGTYFWDGTKNWSGAGAILWRTFDVSLDFFNNISDPVIGAAVTKMAPFIKPAGMNMTVEYF